MENVTHAAAPAPTSRRTMRLSRLGDELLVAQAARGSERAFAALYERYHQMLYRYCRSILRDDPDAQDAMQSTFAAALSTLQRGPLGVPLRPWLFRVAHNESISLLRRRTRSLSHPPPAPVQSASERAGERARFATLVEDLAALSERQRSALVMRELSGLSHEEIAVVLGSSVGAAKQTIFEARQTLFELAEGRAMACEEVRRTISDGDRRALRGRRVRSHLRDCVACDAFAAAIPARRAELRALAPMLPPAAAAALFTRTASSRAAVGGASGSASGGVGSGAGAGAVAKGVGAAVWSKAAVGAVVAATAVAGVGGVAVVTHLVEHGNPSRHVSTPRQSSSRPPAHSAAARRPSSVVNGVRTRHAVRAHPTATSPPSSAPTPPASAPHPALTTRPVPRAHHATHAQSAPASGVGRARTDHLDGGNGQGGPHGGRGGAESGPSGAQGARSGAPSGRGGKAPVRPSRGGPASRTGSASARSHYGAAHAQSRTKS